MARFNKKSFLKSELGCMWIETVRAWDYCLKEHDDSETDSLLARHEAIQTAVRQFYGIEYHFTRTDDFFGLVTEDYEDWLYRAEKKPCKVGEFGYRTLNESTAQNDGYADVELYGTGGGNTEKIYRDTPIPKRGNK